MLSSFRLLAVHVVVTVMSVFVSVVVIMVL